MGYPSSQKGYKCYVPRIGTSGRLFVTIDVSFHEEIPFYSSASLELLPDCSEKESGPLVDSISPPTYPVHDESTMEGGLESKVPQEGEVPEKIQRPLQFYSRKRARQLLSSIPSSFEALNPYPKSQPPVSV